MSGEQDEREALASVIERAYDGRVFGSYGADAVLASSWLADHDRRVEARALREAARDVRQPLCASCANALDDRADRLERGE